MKLSHSATILDVKDIEQALKYFTDKLGFTCTFTWEDPVTYAILKRDGVSFHLTRNEKRDFERIRAYVFVDQIEELYQELTDRGAEISDPLAMRDYGMKDFDVRIPGGHRVAFGEGTH